MYCKNNAYIFSGCRAENGNPAMGCSCSNITFADARKDKKLARLYVKEQAYENCACPTYALKNGTFFNSLYMPYAPKGCCNDFMDAGCIKKCNCKGEY